IDEEQLELASNHPGISMELNTGEITYESETGFKISADTATTLEKLEQTFTSNAVGIAVVVDGKTLGYVKDEVAAANILNRVQKQYAPLAAEEEESRTIEVMSFSTAEAGGDAEASEAEANNAKELTSVGDTALSIKEVNFVESVDLTVEQIEPTDIMEEEAL